MITNWDDVIDSRDVIERIAELEDRIGDLDVDEGRELEELTELAEQGANLEDWEYGVTLVHENHFEDYAQQLAEDIGAVNADASWPNTHIDWAAAAEDLQQDYTSVDYAGTNYYAR